MEDFKAEATERFGEIEDYIAQMPDDIQNRAWGLVAMALCNAEAALTIPDGSLIKMGVDGQAKASHHGLGQLRIIGASRN